ncbi:MAG: Jag N-terminal domain-containing protein [Deltaproteobacteria bacterium]|nr:Jag N-terminal domain-containing protein [Deltaproteobacteria bacterium]
MSTLEFEEKSVEDAIDLACRQLKLPREKLEIEIISKGSSGIFGIVGARRARGQEGKNSRHDENSPRRTGG